MNDYELKHYRTPGSKNGVRKYQNYDGTLTPLGYIHYGIEKNGKSYSGNKTLEKKSGWNTVKTINKYNPSRLLREPIDIAINMHDGSNIRKRKNVTGGVSISKKENDQTVQNIQESYKPVEQQLEKAAQEHYDGVYLSDLMSNANRQILAAGDQFVHSPIVKEKMIRGGFTESLIRVIQYLSKNPDDYSKNRSIIKSPAYWMNFGGRPRINQTR